MMNLRRDLAVGVVVVLGLMVGSGIAAAQPPAPSPLSPAAGASVQVPFTLSWSAVDDPSGIVAYNWQISTTTSFAQRVAIDSTMGETQDTVSGLANGTYVWRVQAVNNQFQQGPWSAPQSFTVTGTGAGAPGSPTLGPPKGYSTFHPYEVMTFNWSAVPGASTYLLQAATDQSFPVASRIQFDNIPNTTYSFAVGNPEGDYVARVFAVTADGVFSAPSNLIGFSVFYKNPVPPALSPLSPANGATLTLPLTITWSDSPNPQPSGYDLQIARDPGFNSIEDLDSQLNNPSRTVLSLTPGVKYWRVHSVQGDSSPTTAAVTPWSATRSFTVSSAPPKPVSVSFTTNPVTSGGSTWVQLQLSGAPAADTVINLTSSNPTAAPVPATVTMPANLAWTQFMIQAGQVASSTPVTITATLNGGSASGSLTVGPTALKSLTISPRTINGGAVAGGIVMLTGQAPPGGAAVTLSSDSSAVTPPASVFVNQGEFSVSFPLQTSNVSANTTATITASWNGASTPAQVTVTPQPAPSSIALAPSSTVGSGGGSFATVSTAAAQSTDTIFQVTSSHPTIAQVPNSVMVPSGTTRGGFNIFTTGVTQQTLVTISVSGGSVTRSATLTVNPDATAPPPSQPPANPATLTVSATGRSGQRVTSSPSGIDVAVGSTSSASFSTGTSITLTVSGGRSAVWSGACSSGGSKRRTCTFTLNGTASVNANVQ